MILYLQVPRDPISFIHGKRKTSNCPQIARVCSQFTTTQQLSNEKHIVIFNTRISQIERCNYASICAAPSFYKSNGKISSQIDNVAWWSFTSRFQQVINLLATAGDGPRNLVSFIQHRDDRDAIVHTKTTYTNLFGRIDESDPNAESSDRSNDTEKFHTCSAIQPPQQWCTWPLIWDGHWARRCTEWIRTGNVSATYKSYTY